MRIWNRPAALLAAVLASWVVSACSTPPEPSAGGASITIAASQALSSADVALVRVEVSGPGVATPLSLDLAREGEGWGGTLEGIPAGQRTFEAFAADASGQVLFKGRAGPVLVVGGSSVSVVLVLQSLSVPPAYSNAAPLIDALTASVAQVAPDGTVDLALQAHDPDGDALSVTWSASGGAFSAADAPVTRWTAPGTEGDQVLTATVTDARGLSAQLTVPVRVAPRRPTGSAVVSATLSTWPQVTAMTAVPSRVVESQPVALTAAAYDEDGDALQYYWYAQDCWGWFDNAYSARTNFYPYWVYPGWQCRLTVQVSDGKGGVNTGTVVLAAGSGTQVNFAPELLSFDQSAKDAVPGEQVTLAVSARDPEGSLLRFSWTATAGALLEQRDDAGASTVTWRAPGCMSGPVSVVATVTDVTGLAATQTFEVAAREPTDCSASGVTGTQQTVYVQEDGTEQVVPADLTRASPAAVVPRADGSGYDTLFGEGHADGTFVIPEVPQGGYFLKSGTSYYWQTARVLDLGRGDMGRPDAAPASTGTRLQLAVSGMSPWTWSDDLQLSAPNAGLGYAIPACASGVWYPDEGQTAWSWDFDYVTAVTGCNGRAPLLDASRGDVTYVTQLAGRTLDASGNWTMAEVRNGARVSFTLADGVQNTLQATLAPLEVTGSATFDLRTRRLEAFAAQAHPSASLIAATGATLSTLPRSAQYGQSGGYPDLAMLNATNTGLEDVVQAAAFANPYPAHWKRSAHAVAAAVLPLSEVLPDGSRSRARNVYPVVQVYEPAEGSGPVLLDPQVSAPRSLQVSGLPVTEHHEAVGAQPVLAWGAPETGTPTHYTVRLYSLTGGSATVQPTRRLVARIVTPDTSLQLPLELQPGVTYYAIVAAQWEPGWSAERPFANGERAHVAEAVTQTFRR